MMGIPVLSFSIKNTHKSDLKYKLLFQNACKQILINVLFSLEIVFIPALNLNNISQTGIQSPECIPGMLHINKLPGKMIPF